MIRKQFRVYWHAYRGDDKNDWLHVDFEHWEFPNKIAEFDRRIQECRESKKSHIQKLEGFYRSEKQVAISHYRRSMIWLRNIILINHALGILSLRFHNNEFYAVVGWLDKNGEKCYDTVQLHDGFFEEQCKPGFKEYIMAQSSMKGYVPLMQTDKIGANPQQVVRLKFI